MNLEKLSPSGIDSFSKILKKQGLEISAFEIFLDALLGLIDPYADINVYTQKVNKIVQQLPLSDLDQINDFLSQYNDFHNRSVDLINSYKEITDNDRAEEYVLTLFDHFWDNSDPKNSFEVLLQKTDALIAEVINTHHIDMNRVLADEKHHIEILSEYIGEQAAFLFITLLILFGKMNDGNITVDDKDRLGIALVAYCALVALMNELRMVILEEDGNQNILSKTVIKIGRNDPCPCGSGKKYKKCCIFKDK